MTRLRLCKAGSVLLKLFLGACCVFTVLYGVDLFRPPFGFSGLLRNPVAFWIRTVLIVSFCGTLFWTGIALVYLNCSQLRIGKRVLGIVLGWVPVANLIMLLNIIATADREYRFESEKIRLDRARADRKICQTKYPLLLVHGVFFRDFRHFNYWGRIPRALEQNGAAVFYGNHNSASSVSDSAEQLRQRVKGILEETGCEKVNIIAHSKGGLDVRALLADPEAAACVASVTTINTPHRGCKFADYLFEKLPRSQQERVAKVYNAAAAKLGDTDPDFLQAVGDLTYEKCRERNETLPEARGVFFQSFGSVQKKAASGHFPLNLTHTFVKYFDGQNDGLVGVDSFPWGSRYRLLLPAGKRGISHADMIDLNRENIEGFDVREFYVQLVADLKAQGY